MGSAMSSEYQDKRTPLPATQGQRSEFVAELVDAGCVSTIIEGFRKG
jgi:hypothetical protein